MNELWAALIGALVGGGLTSFAASQTTKSQWRREDKARKHELLEKQLRVAVKALISATKQAEGDNTVKLDEDTAQAWFTCWIKATAVSPHLGSLVEQLIFDGDDTKVAISFEDARRIFMVVSRWRADPDAFEAERPPLHAFKRQPKPEVNESSEE